MQLPNVSFTTEWDLCCGCGICVGVCPKDCIHWKRDKGLYQPEIDKNACISCGMCTRVCPGLGHQYNLQEESAAVRGNVQYICNAWSRFPDVRHVSASGGVVSTLVQCLLRNGSYDVAFLVNSYDYRQQLTTSPVVAQDVESIAASNYPKSRYLPVSHENALAYVKQNQTKRVIFVGTSCAIRGFRAAIEQLHLLQDNFLLIGLFCDRVFNYNVMQYYQQSAFCGSKKLKSLHFKNKESGGWPGNMKLFFSDGSSAYRDKSERVKMKDFFMPERCLYCIDKLNVCADISLGDNYTSFDASPLGSNSVIVRTEAGLAAWKKASRLFEQREISIEQVAQAQYITGRLNNLCYAQLKEKEILKRTGQRISLNSGVITQRKAGEYRAARQSSLQMLRIGEAYSDAPTKMQKLMEKSIKRKNSYGARSYFSRVYHFIKRRIKREKRA